MAKLDSFLELMIRRAGSQLELSSEQPPRLWNGNRATTVARNPLSADQLVSLLGEIVPSEDRRRLRSEVQGTFSCHRLETELVGHWLRDGDRLQIRLSAASGPVPDAVAATSAMSGTEPPPEGRNSTPDGEPTAGNAACSVGPEGAPEIHRLLDLALEARASDLHLTAGLEPFVRVDGRLQVLESVGPLSGERLRRLLFEIAPERSREQFLETSDTDYAYEYPGRSRFRVNLFVDRRGLSAVVRAIPLEVIPAERLGLSEAIQELSGLTKGLVLVTGPTGSGKSTTLAALIDRINRTRDDHIITVEDPIEFVHDNRSCLVHQREVGEHTGSFKAALRAALREDPDVVLVGEMRDLETIAIAIETAATGHLVFGTLHTATAPGTIDRVVDQFPADQQSQIRVMLADTLRGVVAQTLLRKVGGGRVAAHEVLLGTTAVSNLIREGKTFQLPTAMQTGRKAGMCTLNDSLLELLRTGVVEPEEAHGKAVDRDGLRALMQRHGIAYVAATA